MKKSRVTQKDILFISGSMFLIIALWIGFTLYNSWVTSTISDDLNLQIVPIAPKFDTQTLNNLKSREKIEPLSGSLPQATPVPTESAPTESEEVVLTPTEEPLPINEELLPTEEPVPTL